MHVHLVAVEIGVVRRRDREVESEGRVRHDAHLVTHHRHLVQRRLAIEDNVVAVLNMSLDLVAVLEEDVLGFTEAKVSSFAIVANHILGTRIFLWAITD